MANADNLKRRINYLRISVTDRCNLRCKYCFSLSGSQWLDHTDILSYEEILEMARAGVEIGVEKIRFTGGEPLVRKNIVELVRSTGRLAGIRSLGLTTNGVLLEPLALPLKDAGLTGINVSLDTLDPQRFLKITGRDYFRSVWAGLEAALSAGFKQVKTNTVVIKGMNDGELEKMAALSLDRPLAVRFIEYMPIGRDSGWAPSKFMSVQEMKSRLESLGPLLPVSGDGLDGPAERFRFPGAAGEIGFIGAVSRHFCGSCNRLRLTSDGRLRPCLMSDLELDVKTPLRRGCSRKELGEMFTSAIKLKPAGYFPANPDQPRCRRNMSSIGG